MTVEAHTHATAFYTDWCAIAGGTVLTLALSFVLFTFGSAVGYTNELTIDPADITPVAVITGGVWVLVVQLLVSLLGGYIAGRMRTPVNITTPHEREVRDGVHGLLVWASGTVIMAAGAALLAALSALAATQTGTGAEAELSDAAQRLEGNAAIIMAFVTGATALVSAVAAWWAGTKGGDHRDEGVHAHLSFRR